MKVTKDRPGRHLVALHVTTPRWGELDGPPLEETRRYRLPTDPSGLAVPGVSGRPFVYATLGTVFNTTRRLLKAFIAAIDDGGWSGLVPVGRTNDPARFERPARVAVEQYVPQPDGLALADVMAVDSLSRTSPPRATARSLAARLTAG